MSVLPPPAWKLSDEELLYHIIPSIKFLDLEIPEHLEHPHFPGESLGEDGETIHRITAPRKYDTPWFRHYGEKNTKMELMHSIKDRLHQYVSA